MFIKTKFELGFQTGTTALFFAAQGGFLDIVKLLLDHGAPVDSPSLVSFPFHAQCIKKLVNATIKHSLARFVGKSGSVNNDTKEN